MQEQLIVIEKLNISLGSQVLFKDFSFNLEKGNIVGIYAPTGSGKSTLLNYIADLFTKESPFEMSGSITKKKDLNISFVFQEPRLLEFESVYKNVLLPVEERFCKEKIDSRIDSMLHKVNLSEKKNTLCKDLSGGEKQRTSLARAFIFPFEVILMDEPFASQDEKNKESLIELTKNLLKEENRSAIIISHNKNELEALCTTIITEKDFI